MVGTKEALVPLPAPLWAPFFFGLLHKVPLGLWTWGPRGYRTTRNPHLRVPPVPYTMATVGAEHSLLTEETCWQASVSTVGIATEFPHLYNSQSSSGTLKFTLRIGNCYESERRKRSSMASTNPYHWPYLKCISVITSSKIRIELALLGFEFGHKLAAYDVNGL